MGARVLRCVLALCVSLASCSNNEGNNQPEPDDGALRFGAMGPLSGDAGKGSFRFGAATAAAQIEDGLTDSDWYFWTLPEADGGLGKSVPVGDAVRGKSLAVQDVTLMTDMSLDAYRFSVDWSRVEPQRDQISQEALEHYSGLLDTLKAAKVRPMITIHHFSNPIWVHDFRTDACDQEAATVADANLCGWGHPVGGEQIIEELAEHAALLARTYGDRVDDWCTLNEPINYLIASYGTQVFPPAANLIFSDPAQLVRAFRNYLRAHVAVYDAIKKNDTVDADGDGVAAEVGFSLSVADWVPAASGKPSAEQRDIDAAARVWYVYHHLYPDALMSGSFDADLDGTPDEQHPDWKGKVDWLGVQYYFRAGVTGKTKLVPFVDATICAGGFDFGSCLDPEDPTHWVPSMHYEFWAPGLHKVLKDMSARYPTLPLVVTEAGIATKEGKRRAENVVRTLEQIHQAREEGVDVRGYYHWSLMDNFEWAEGYEPKFGLYAVDLSTYARTPTEGATVLGEIARSRKVTVEQAASYGGNGPMTPEPGVAGE